MAEAAVAHAPTPPRVIAVAAVLPWPLDRGDPIRTFQLANAIHEAGLPVSLWAIDRADGTGDADGLGAAFPGDVRVFPLDPAPSTNPWIRRMLRWARALRWGMPPSFTERQSRQLGRALADASPDVVLLLGDSAGAFATRSLRDDALVAWDKYNVLTVSFATGKLRRERVAVSRLARRYEQKAQRNLDLVSVTSAEEAKRFAAVFGSTPNVVLPSGIVGVERSAERSPREGVIGWMGNLGYQPNAHGLREIVDVWPTAGPRLEVVGPTDPTPKLQRRMEARGVVWRGFVDDLSSWLASLHVGIVPLWHGAGVKMKTLEFLAHAVPVVATPVALEGLRHDWAVAVADEPAELVAALDRLVQSPPRSYERRAKRVVDEMAAELDWKVLGRRYAHVLTTALEERRRDAAS